MRFLVSVAVITSPLVCLLAVFMLDDAAAGKPPGPSSARSSDPLITGSLDPGPARILPNTLGRWRTSLRLTPEQSAAWVRLEPGTARALATAPGLSREICAGQSGGVRRSEEVPPALVARLSERQARFAPLQQAWSEFERGLSPRQARRYRSQIAPRLEAAFAPLGGSDRCPTGRAGLHSASRSARAGP
jgi:hypothetical protein